MDGNHIIRGKRKSNFKDVRTHRKMSDESKEYIRAATSAVLFLKSYLNSEHLLRTSNLIFKK